MRSVAVAAQRGDPLSHLIGYHTHRANNRPLRLRSITDAIAAFRLVGRSAGGLDRQDGLRRDKTTSIPVIWDVTKKNVSRDNNIIQNACTLSLVLVNT